MSLTQMGSNWEIMTNHQFPGTLSTNIEDLTSHVKDSTWKNTAPLNNQDWALSHGSVICWVILRASCSICLPYISGSQPSGPKGHMSGAGPVPGLEWAPRCLSQTSTQGGSHAAPACWDWASGPCQNWASHYPSPPPGAGIRPWGLAQPMPRSLCQDLAP